MIKIYTINITQPLAFTRYSIKKLIYGVEHLSMKRIDYIRQCIYEFYLKGFNKIKIATAI